MSGRPAVLTSPKIRAIDEWVNACGRNRSPPAKVMAYKMGVSVRTLWNVIHRRGGYARVP